MNPLAKKIQEARLKAKMSEKDLAKKCGLAASYIIQIESGKKIINEKTAETILAVFGERVEMDFMSEMEQEKPAPKPIVKKEAPKPVQPHIAVEPNDQWAGALANIIKTFPIQELSNNKMVGSKELPVLNKSIEGIPWEKLMFFRASDDDAKELRIQMGDVVWVQQIKEIQGKGVYLIEIKNKKMIRRLHKTNNKFEISTGSQDKTPVTAELHEVKILGKCVRVETTL